MEIRHYFQKTVELIPVVEHAWRFDKDLVVSSLSICPEIRTLTVIPGNSMGDTGSYSMLENIAIENFYHLTQEYRNNGPEAYHYIGDSQRYSDDLYDNIPFNYTLFNQFNHGAEEILSTAYIVDEDDDSIVLLRVDRCMKVMLSTSTTWGPEVPATEEELEKFAPDHYYTRKKGNKLRYCKTEYNSIASNILGHDVYSLEYKYLFYKNVYKVKYRKSNSTWSSTTAIKKKKVTSFTTRAINYVFKQADSGSVNMFLDLVLAHLNQVTGKSKSFPESHYELYGNQIMPAKITWLRRFRRNLYDYNEILVASLPINLLGKKPTSILKHYKVPSTNIEKFLTSRNIYPMLIAAKLGLSFNTNGGIFNIKSKPSADRFYLIQAILEKKEEIDKATNNYSYHDNISCCEEVDSVKNPYVLYLLQKRVIDTLSAYKKQIENPFEQDEPLPWEENAPKTIAAKISITTFDWDSKNRVLHKKIVDGYATYDFKHAISQLFFAVSDTDRLLTNIINHGYAHLVEPKRSLMEFHDHLATIHRKIVQKNVPVPNPEKYIMETNDYIIKKPPMTHDIIEVGEIMKICVGMYTNYVLSLSCEIVVLYEKDTMKPIACINVKNNTVVESKLACNVVTKKLPEINNIIISWAEKEGLEISTYDINSYELKEIN